MKAYTYKNTKTSIPQCEITIHLTQKFGYGYETTSHFVHFYGKEDFFTISSGLTVVEEKKGTFLEWINNRFGATDVEALSLEVGNTIQGIWRPALYYWEDIASGISINPNEQRSEEQALRILIEKLDELLLFIEPSVDGLNSFSHKTRELLILACTEVENQWRSLLSIAGHNPINGKDYTTNDYVKLAPISRIDEYQVCLKKHPTLFTSKPFNGWERTNPTKSLPWYDAYNKTKHNRDLNFHESKLKYAIDAVAANIILYCTRFGALVILQDSTTLSGLVKQIFEIKMINTDRKSFYLPELEFPVDTRKDCFLFDSYRSHQIKTKPWIVNKLTV